MSLGKRGPNERQEPIWIEAASLATPVGHPFYEHLNRLLDKRGFDAFAENACLSFYAKVGRPGLAPGVYFRALMVGYFEGIDSERGIAWRTADSLALRSFLGFEVSQATPDHSTISRTRRLIDVETHRKVFLWVLRMLAEEGLLKGNTVAIDGTTLEANAALRSIVRRDTGEAYEEFLKGLAKESGIETPTRCGEHIREVAMETSNEAGPGQLNPDGPAELVLNKGYHSSEVLVILKEAEVRSYCSEPDRGRRNWIGKRGRGGSRLPEPAAHPRDAWKATFVPAWRTGRMQLRSHVRSRRPAKDASPASRQHHQTADDSYRCVQSRSRYAETVGLRNPSLTLLRGHFYLAQRGHSHVAPTNPWQPLATRVRGKCCSHTNKSRKTCSPVRRE